MNSLSAADWALYFKTTPQDESDNTLIKIKYLPGAHAIKQEEYGDWIDLYTYEDVHLQRFDRQYINLGIAMKLPQGYEAIMAPRSSTYKNWGILQTNGIGVIDSTYCGDNDIWMFPALAMRETIIPANTRICQFRIQLIQPRINFVSVSSLGTEDRGGLGSSGL